jgi:hypothetical protein
MYCISVIRYITVFVLIFSEFSLVAQHLPTGAQAAGLGFATVAFEGNMAVWGNAAGLSKVRNKKILTGYENRYGLVEGLHAVQAAYVHPLPKSTLAVSVYRFGDDLYSQHRLSLTAAQQIGQFRGGLRVSQHQYSMEGADTRFALAIDAGGIMKISEQLLVGMHISNVSQARVSRQTNERIPTILGLGLNYAPDDQLRLLAELAYEIDQSPVVKVGMEYTPLDFLTFRSGINSGPQSIFFFGLGLRHSVLHFDYALETHQVLGLAQHIGLTYQFSANAKP